MHFSDICTKCLPYLMKQNICLRTLMFDDTFPATELGEIFRDSLCASVFIC
uniref:Uncharacterized protein n=1 Tax=Arion vulgaris TaxID=1028688 RepID=A0A0B6Z0Q3_9EUPU